jgi:hypothetical protein
MKAQMASHNSRISKKMSLWPGTLACHLNSAFYRPHTQKCAAIAPVISMKPKQAAKGKHRAVASISSSYLPFGRRHAADYVAGVNPPLWLNT